MVDVADADHMAYAPITRLTFARSVSFWHRFSRTTQLYQFQSFGACEPTTGFNEPVFRVKTKGWYVLRSCLHSKRGGAVLTKHPCQQAATDASALKARGHHKRRDMMSRTLSIRTDADGSCQCVLKECCDERLLASRYVVNGATQRRKAERSK